MKNEIEKILNKFKSNKLTVQDSLTEILDLIKQDNINYLNQVLTDAVASNIINTRTVQSIYNIQIGISAGWNKHTKI